MKEKSNNRNKLQNCKIECEKKCWFQIPRRFQKIISTILRNISNEIIVFPDKRFYCKFNNNNKDCKKL